MAKALVLIGISDSQIGVRQIIAGRVTRIGSLPGCDFVVKDRRISPHHAEIRQVLDRWFVAPLDPSAQVFINGQTVRTQARVNAGDTLTFGTATFTVATDEEVARAVGSTSTLR